MNFEQLTKEREGEVFPSITISTKSIAAPQMISLLKKGDTQLIFERDGKPNLVVAMIDKSPLNMRKLLMVTDKVTFNLSATERFPIKTIEDYLGVL